jgi:hypothetical protein
MRVVEGLFITTLSLSVSGCISWGDKSPPPAITHEMPLEDAIVRATERGGVYMQQIRDRLKEKNEWAQAEELLQKLLLSSKSLDVATLANAIELYRIKKPSNPEAVFRKLVNSKTIAARQLGWKVASDFPSKKMAAEIDLYLSNAIGEDEVNRSYLAEMAVALAANQMGSSYSVIREAFYEMGDVEYARAMANLEPKKASSDFMPYLQQAPIEELRQLNFESVSPITCTLIFEHFAAYPPEISNTVIETLVNYSISRNNAVADMARDVLEGYIDRDARFTALVMARMPSWIQVAFVERSQRQMTPVVARLLDELAIATPHKDVASEISEIRR